MLNFEKGWRGGERQTLLCMQQFRKAGHDVALLSRRDSALSRIALQQGFTVFEEGSVVGVCWRLWQQRDAFDVFHAQTANMVTWLAILKPILNGLTVFTRRTAFQVRRRQALTAWKWRRVDILVAITQAAANEPRRLGACVDYVIPSAVEYQDVDVTAIEAERQKHGLNGGHIIATVAALTREKDPMTLVETVHQLRLMRDDFVFLHYGSSGPLEAAVRQKVREYGLQDHYIYAGFRANVSDYYRLMDVFVLSSREEALGSSVLDAFQYGVPVVSTKAGGLVEVLADERGMLCAVGDSECLAQSIHRMLDDAALRKKMMTKAKNYVLKEHSLQVMAQRYLSAYAEHANLEDKKPDF